jgi:hypothetical protein
MPEVVCPSCRKKIHPPARLAGRRVTCPRCEAILTVPIVAADSDEDVPTAGASPPKIEEAPVPLSTRLGIGAMILGTSSVLVLCLPFIGGYASVGLSGVGLVLALCGLVQAGWHDTGGFGQPLAAGAVGVQGGFGARARDYPLAGIAVCALALILALLPSFFR